MSKTIFEFCDNFYPQVDGVGKVVYNYGQQFSKTDNCYVIVPNFKRELGITCDFHVFLKNNAVLKLPDTLAPINLPDHKLTKKLIALKPDIVHCHSPFAVGHYGIKIARKCGVPVVATFHSQFKEDMKEYVKLKLLSKIVLKYIVNFYKKCDEVWAVSEAAARMLRSYGFKKEIKIMTNGVDFTYPNNIEETKEKVAKEYGFDFNKKNIFYIGQIRKAKNVKLILETLRELNKKRQDFHMFFAGTGAFLKKAIKLSKKWKIDDKVTFLGVIKDKEILASLLSSSDVFFFPSTYDTFSLVVREANVCKVPVLLVKGSGAADGFVDGKNGYLEEEDAKLLSNKLEYIFDHKEEAIKCAEEATSVPKRWNELIPEVSKEYDLLINKYKNI